MDPSTPLKAPPARALSRPPDRIQLWRTGFPPVNGCETDARRRPSRRFRRVRNAVRSDPPEPHPTGRSAAQRVRSPPPPATPPATYTEAVHRQTTSPDRPAAWLDEGRSIPRGRHRPATRPRPSRVRRGRSTARCAGRAAGGRDLGVPAGSRGGPICSSRCGTLVVTGRTSSGSPRSRPGPSEVDGSIRVGDRRLVNRGPPPSPPSRRRTTARTACSPVGTRRLGASRSRAAPPSVRRRAATGTAGANSSRAWPRPLRVTSRCRETIARCNASASSSELGVRGPLADHRREVLAQQSVRLPVRLPLLRAPREHRSDPGRSVVRPAASPGSCGRPRSGPAARPRRSLGNRRGTKKIVSNESAGRPHPLVAGLRARPAHALRLPAAPVGRDEPGRRTPVPGHACVTSRPATTQAAPDRRLRSPPLAIGQYGAGSASGGGSRVGGPAAPPAGVGETGST